MTIMDVSLLFNTIIGIPVASVNMFAQIFHAFHGAMGKQNV